MREYRYCPFCGMKLGTGQIEGRQRKSCPACGWINYLNPVPVVACLVKNEEGKILLIKRGIAPCKGAWALPGGFVELGETPEMAGERELFEETGLRGDFDSFVGACSQKSVDYGYVMIVGMSYKVPSAEPAPGDDAEEAKFIPLGELPEIPFSCHRRMIELFVGAKK